MDSMTIPPTADQTRRRVIVGVDTHKYAHVAVAVDHLGARIGAQHVPANRQGYAQLEAWAASLAGGGRVSSFGVEGTGSYGAGLAGYLRRAGHRVIEVNRGDRRARRSNGKSDTLDAEAAARAVLGGQATAIPKSADGGTEMIRQIKIARDTARKARTSAIMTLKALLVTAPADLREQLGGLSDKALIQTCAALRPGAMTSPTASAKHGLRALAKRHQRLEEEIREHDALLDDLTRSLAPTLRQGSRHRPGHRRGDADRLRRTTPAGSIPRRLSPSSAAPAPCRHPPASPTATGSPGPATERPTPPSTGP